MGTMRDLLERAVQIPDRAFMQEPPHVPGEISLVRDDFKNPRRWEQILKAFEIDDPKAVRHLRLALRDAYVSDELPMDWK